ncbi:DUF4365 domain-containing protein [Mycobacterium sp. PDNC021]|uniref:DUF4365 domain-containing protein n=1 Tax=Mycobacterium sp. PDNC021 TaxID=3391399 RepID=UPI003AAC7717
MADRKMRARQHVTARVAVNVVRSFLEERGQIYHEVDQANDYGKDAYVDVVLNGGVTGDVIALQVKGGPSYKSRAGYFIPYGAADKELWANSSVPVFGIVCDLEDRALYWVCLTDVLSKPNVPGKGKIAVDGRLASDTWHDFLSNALHESKRRGAGLLGIYSRDPDQQLVAIRDAFAIGRHDARAMIMLRRSLCELDERTLPYAIDALAHCVPFHPDIMWHSMNTVLYSVKAEVCREFNWTLDDAFLLLRAVDSEELFRRGTLGEHVYLLLSEGWLPDVVDLFARTLSRAVAVRDDDVAYKVLILLQYQAGEDARELLQSAMDKHTELQSIPMVLELVSAVREFGWVDIE